MTCLNYSTCHFKLSQLYQKLPDFFFILPVHDILNIILKIHVSVASISSTITTTVDAGSEKAGCTLSPAESNWRHDDDDRPQTEATVRGTCLQKMLDSIQLKHFNSQNGCQLTRFLGKNYLVRLMPRTPLGRVERSPRPLAEFNGTISRRGGESKMERTGEKERERKGRKKEGGERGCGLCLLVKISADSHDDDQTKLFKSRRKVLNLHKNIAIKWRRNAVSQTYLSGGYFSSNCNFLFLWLK